MNKAEISFARELYEEHGFSTQYIAKHFGCRNSTVIKYLGKQGVELAEESQQLVLEREQLIAVFKTLTTDFADLEERNHAYIINLWNEVKNG